MIGKNDELISRQMAIKSMTNAIWHYPNELYSDLNTYPNAEALAKYGLEYLPSVQPRKGKWLRSGSDIFPYECDQCGDINERTTSWCPHCGADMRGDEE